MEVWQSAKSVSPPLSPLSMALVALPELFFFGTVVSVWFN